MRPYQLALMLPAAVLLAGCGGDGGDGDGDGDGGGDDTRTVEVRGTHAAFVADLPAGAAITAVDETGECGAVSYRISGDGDFHVYVEVVPTACSQAVDNSDPGNGRHGLYRTVEDVPEPQDESEVATGLGPATVFEQTYYECTNECQEWSEPVAIVTLDEPVDPGYPTLVVHGDKDAVSREQLETLVAGLDAPLGDS